MNKRRRFFRGLSIALLVVYLQCFLPPPEAVCGPSAGDVFGIGASPAVPHRAAEASLSTWSPAGVMRAGGTWSISGEPSPAPDGALSPNRAPGRTEGEVTDPESKPWYGKWWVVGLGAAVVAGSILLLAGGGDDDEPARTPALPSFPDPPAASFR